MQETTHKNIIKPKVYRADAAATVGNVSKSTIWNYSKKGLLTPIHVTKGVTVFSADEVHKLFGIANAK